MDNRQIGRHLGLVMLFVASQRLARAVALDPRTATAEEAAVVTREPSLRAAVSARPLRKRLQH